VGERCSVVYEDKPINYHINEKVSLRDLNSHGC